MRAKLEILGLVSLMLALANCGDRAADNCKTRTGDGICVENKQAPAR